jgi:hypothetical protein
MAPKFALSSPINAHHDYTKEQRKAIDVKWMRRLLTSWTYPQLLLIMGQCEQLALIW